MNMIDWLIVAIPVAAVLYFGIKTSRLASSVLDYLAARRIAGRYLLCVAHLEAGQGLVSLVSMWEMYFISGFAIIFWYNLTAPLTLVFSLSGYCIYRFRETKAMTMGQFLEIRYNRPFRITAAFIQIFAGIFSYSLFPAVGARCIMYFCGLPEKIQVAGIQCPTFILLVTLFLSAATLAVCMGGQVTVMVTDCIQGLISYPLYAILVFYVISRFSWENDIVPALLNRQSGQSMVNPYDIKQLRDFNLFWVISGLLGSTLGRMSWSGSMGYQGAALNPHEQKMGMMIGGFRAGFASLMTLTFAIGSIAYLSGSNFSKEADAVYSDVARKVVCETLLDKKYTAVRSELLELISTGSMPQTLKQRLSQDKNNQPLSVIAPKQYSSIIRSAVSTIDRKKAQNCTSIFQQMLIPVTVQHILPPGLTGIMCLVMLFLMFSTDTTSLHSWGSILIQDIILPFRKKELSQQGHIMLLRLSVCFVALCAFCGAVLFEQTDYILMFFTIATAIWIAGSGPAITLGLYWSKGNSSGAFASLLTGSTIAISGILMQQNWAKHIYPFLAERGWIPGLEKILDIISSPFQPYIQWDVTPAKFPINSMEWNFSALLLSLAAYTVVSLITARKTFDLNKMLHRNEAQKKFQWTKKRLFERLFGIDANYTTGDKIIAFSVFFWTFIWGFLLTFLGIVIWNRFYQWPDSWWCHRFLIVMIIAPGIVALITTIWFSWGGLRDLKQMFIRLKQNQADDHENGQVLKNDRNKEK